MKSKDLKETIGDRAEYIISSELGIQKSGDSYPCRISDHKKGDRARMIWFSDGDTNKYSFYCNDCHGKMDIINHAEALHGNGMMSYLASLAGDTSTPIVKQVKKEAPKVKVIQDFAKLKEIDFLSVELEDDASEWLESRGISRETADAYGITGNSEGCHFNYYIPMEDEDPKVVFLKSRRLGDIKNGDNKYFCQKGGTPVLYGMHMFTGQPILIITEGEVDCISFYEGVSFVGATDKVTVCSVPTGTSHTWAESCKSFISKFKMIVVVSDNDEAGVKFRELCFQKLDYCDDVRWIDMGQVLPKGKKFNDVNDYLRLSGKGKVGALLSKIEKPYHSCGVSGNKIEKSDNTGHVKSGFFGMDRALGGLRFSNVSLLAGESND